jgi:hypothetical protein
MLQWIARRLRRRRAIEYLKYFPEDEAMVLTALSAFEVSALKNARELAEIIAGRELQDDEWSDDGFRWERLWRHVIKL